MSKNEAVNTFNGGLVMDLNPISTPNNVLTNCLNGTLITYNGNEYTLQSDMGNGRVETAYLPAGYVPVGIKEHGGVIYVAAHNPLTGKSQIGSFPSPERNISSEELGDSDAVINFSKFSNNLVQRIKLFGEDTVIRSGDKFSIIMIPNISGTSSSLHKLVSNYQNILNGDVATPKNKLITLDVAVLDSNNNLHSVTNTLKRFDQSTNKEVEDLYQLSQDVRFNTEYFTQTFSKPLDTNSGNSVDQFRQIKARNVFNSKLVGNLCIVATLNTLSQFELAIGGTKNEGSTTLYLDSTFEYNCPDGRYNGSYTYGSSSDFEPSNSIIGYDLSLEEGRSAYRIDFRTSGINFDSDTYDTGSSSVKYSSENNLYISRQLDTQTISQTSGIIKYVATPISIVGPLNGLKIEGQINLDKLGSGEVNLTHWRYYKNEDYVSLQWGLEAYPKYGEYISDMRFLFFDIYQEDLSTPVYTYNIDKKRNYNGVFTELLHLPEWEDLKNKLFLVKIEYKLNVSDDYQELDYRWLFNTRLYNEIYSKREILDFGIDNELLQEIRKLEVIPTCNLNIARQLKDTTEPKIIINKEDLVVYEQDSYSNFTYSPQTTMSVSNIDKYPFKDQITFKDEYLVDEAKILESMTPTIINGTGNSQENLITSDNYKEHGPIEQEGEGNIKISFKTRLEYLPQDKTVVPTYVFTPIFESVGKYIGEGTSPACLITFAKARNDIRNPDSYGYIRFTNQADTSVSLRDLYYKCDVINSNEENKTTRFVYGLNQARGFNYDAVLDKVKEVNKPIVVLSTFHEAETTWDDGDKGKPYLKAVTSITNNYNTQSSIKYQTAWWINSDGNPVLLDWYVTGSNKISDLLLDTLGNYYKYNSAYSNLEIQVKGLTDTYGYNNSYSVDYNLIINANYTEIKVDLEEYYNRVEATINSVASTYDKKEELKTLATFTFEESLQQEYSSEQTLEVESLESLYLKLKEPKVDYVLGKYQDNIFTVVCLADNLNISRTYQLVNSKPVLASTSFDQFFVEKEGIFYLRKGAQGQAYNNRWMVSTADDVTVVFGFNYLPTAGIAGLIYDSRLNRW